MEKIKKQINGSVLLFFILANSCYAQISTADLIVNPLEVTVGADRLTLKVRVWNLSNNNAQDARIVVMVSQDVNLISAKKTVDGITTVLISGIDYDLYNKHLIIKVPNIDRSEARGVNLEIVTKIPSAPRMKEFGVMAYNKLADGKPADNYKAWSMP